MWLLLSQLSGSPRRTASSWYWLVNEFHGFGPVLQDNLALGFILDVTVTLIILTVYFAKHPPGPVRWPWFVRAVVRGRAGVFQPAAVLLAESALSSQPLDAGSASPSAAPGE